MPSAYIQPDEFSVYGLPNTITMPQVYQASLLIDNYLRRSEGMVWAADFAGLPCYMVGPNPSLTWNSSGSIAPGTDVVVTLSQTYVQPFSDMIGEVLILDRGNPSSTEACVIAAMVGNKVTLSQVQTSHNTGCTMDFGLTIFEERALPVKRSITRTTRPPVRLLSGLGRYGYGRRLDQTMGMFNEVNLLAAIQAFGGPPMWVPFDVSPNITAISYITREIWVPAGILLAYYSEVRLRYVSGFQYSALPQIIKQATANIIISAQQNPFPTIFKTYIVGTNQMDRFAATLLDDDTKEMLKQFRCIPML